MSKDISEARKNEQLERALKHAAGIGMGWFGLTLLARQLLDKSQGTSRNKYDDKLRSYVNARYPVISPDSSKITSLKREGTETDAGLPSFKELIELETKTAEDKGTSVTRAFADKFVNPIPIDPNKKPSISNFVSTLSSQNIHPAHIALTLAAALAGVTAGSKLSNKMSSKSREEVLDKRIADARAEMDKLMFDEYRRTRGLDKSAKAYDVEEDNRGYITKSLSALPKLYLLYAAGVGALAYSISKRFMDDKDPHRARLKALNEYARDRAKMAGAPQIIEDPSDPTYSKLTSM